MTNGIVEGEVNDWGDIFQNEEQFLEGSVIPGMRRFITSAVLTYVATVAWPQGPALLGGPALLSTTFSKSPVRLLECPPCPPRSAQPHQSKP